MGIAIAGLLLSATVALSLEESAELPLETAVEAVDGLARAITARTGISVIVDDPTWSGCKREDRCLNDIASRTRVQEIVLVRVFGGALSHRLLAERFSGRAASRRAEVDLSSEHPEAWSEVLAGAAAALFPEVTARAEGTARPEVVNAPPLGAKSPPPETAWSPWPFVALGAAVALVAGGAVFGARGASARSRLESEVLPEAEHNVLLRRSARSQTAANVLFVGAGVSAAGGVVLFFID